MYKLITIDMDGTLLSSNHKISDYSKEIITKAKKLGVKVVLTSGRPIEGLMPFVKELGLCDEGDYVIGFNGGVVAKADTGEILRKTVITGKDLKDLYKISLDLVVNYHAFTENGLVAQKKSEFTQLECDLNGIDLSIIDLMKIEDDEPVVKSMFVDEPAILERIIPNIPSEVYERFSVVRTAPFFLEFLNKESHKGSGVKFLAEYLGIKQDEVMSIGDEENDFTMIKYAGLGVAMGNAVQKNKEVANFITKTNDENGVAYAIEKFVINGEKLDV